MTGKVNKKPDTAIAAIYPPKQASCGSLPLRSRSPAEPVTVTDTLPVSRHKCRPLILRSSGGTAFRRSDRQGHPKAVPKGRPPSDPPCDCPLVFGLWATMFCKAQMCFCKTDHKGYCTCQLSSGHRVCVSGRSMLRLLREPASEHDEREPRRLEDSDHKRLHHPCATFDRFPSTKH